MANPLDPSVDSNQQLPPPELNPLLNPVLEQNLGRWAQVYFTSPPEQRDHAVGELLRELNSQSRIRDERHEDSVRRLESSPMEKEAPQQNAENELDWLRSKNLLAYEQQSGPRWIWKVAAPLLALVVVGFLYSQWKTRLTAEQHPAPAAAPARSAAPPSAPVSGPIDSQALRRTAAPAETEPAPVVSAPTPSEPRSPAREEMQKASDLKVDDAAGRAELQRAQDYLEGLNGPKDISAAADWLWRAVRRENATAEVLLADLYLRGEGVPKNCEQARLLLIAAAKRGQAAAGAKLQSLESSGCS